MHKINSSNRDNREALHLSLSHFVTISEILGKLRNIVFGCQDIWLVCYLTHTKKSQSAIHGNEEFHSAVSLLSVNINCENRNIKGMT